MSKIERKDLIFIDESGAHLQMGPLYGRALNGERAVVSKPAQYGNKITLISAISINKVEAALYGEWSANGSIFVQFLEQCLVPILKPNHIVVMDNVSFHKVKGVKEVMNRAGAE